MYGVRFVRSVPALLPYPESLLSMANQSQAEGNSGSANMRFPLVRQADGYPSIKFDYQTEPGSATPGVDYTHTSGSGTIASGQTVNIDVPILGDTDVESDETFSVRVFNVRYS